LFTWLISRNSRARAGSIAGCVYKSGYVNISINYKIYSAHRLAFLYMKGYWPTVINHKNNNRHDNCFSNLRECTNSQSIANQGVRLNNTSGYTGVTWHETGHKWRARIDKLGTKYHLGFYDCRYEAAKAYNKKALELFGEFACLNKIEMT